MLAELPRGVGFAPRPERPDRISNGSVAPAQWDSASLVGNASPGSLEQEHLDPAVRGETGRGDSRQLRPARSARHQAGDRDHRKGDERNQDRRGRGPLARPLRITEVHQEDRGDHEHRSDRQAPSSTQHQYDPSRPSHNQDRREDEEPAIPAPEQGTELAPIRRHQSQRVVAVVDIQRIPCSHGGNSPCPGASRTRSGCRLEEQERRRQCSHGEDPQTIEAPGPLDPLHHEIKGQDGRDGRHLELDHRGIGREEAGEEDSQRFATPVLFPEQEE